MYVKRATKIHDLAEAVREIELLAGDFENATAAYSRSGETVQGHVYRNCANKLRSFLRKCEAAIRGPGAAVHG